jgi:hypothetical protein
MISNCNQGGKRLEERSDFCFLPQLVFSSEASNGVESDAMYARAKWYFRMAIVLVATLGSGSYGAFAADQPDDVYQTYGVHNPAADSPCANPNCIYIREPGQPTDPLYPDYWSSNWTMYRVFQGYAQNPPPYDRAPPPALKPGRDYEISKGATYYDNSWRGPAGTGAMMEHYEKRCLPIFPISNQFTCSFISLGDTAFFVTYSQDQPKGMPPVCLFSQLNHPPRPDFISHLPYSPGDSARLGNRVQGYSFWVEGASGKPIQVGVQPQPDQRSGDHVRLRLHEQGDAGPRR